MHVKDLMETAVITIRDDAGLEDVVRLLHEKNISGVPVVDASNHLVGIVSHRDLLRILYPYYDSYYKAPELYSDFDMRECKAAEIRKMSVSRFMSEPTYTTHPDTPILHAGGLMLARGIQRLPVLLGGELVGIVTRKQILREIFRKNFDLD
jgi:CBS domain-containing protein